MPKDFPVRPEFGLYAMMRTAKEVGGDFYDFYFADQNHLVITMADVSGKGVGAALFMLIAKTVLQNFVLTSLGDNDLATVMSKTNDRLAQNNDAMMFVTTFLGLLDLKTGRFTFVNGGHNPPLIFHADSERYEYMRVNKNFVLGPMEDLDFCQQEIQLKAGDRLFLYTDGVTEALNVKKELYGEERLLNTLNRREIFTLNDRDLLTALKKSLDDYADGAEQFDDITMMSLTFDAEQK